MTSVCRGNISPVDESQNIHDSLENILEEKEISTSRLEFHENRLEPNFIIKNSRERRMETFYLFDAHSPINV